MVSPEHTKSSRLRTFIALIALVCRETAVILRFLRWRMLARLRGALWQSITRKQFKQDGPDTATAMPPAAAASPLSDKSDSTTAGAVAVEQVSVPAARPVSITARLLDRFGEKITERESRKRRAARMAAAVTAQNGHRQLEIQFTHPTPLSDDAAPDPDSTGQTYTLPSLSIFKVVETPPGFDQKEIDENSRKIQDCLDSFNVDADVGGATRGPRVTLFHIDVAMGVRVVSVASYAKDLAMALSASSLRIMAPVPGHDYVGIEVPNRKPDLVLCGNILNSPAWRETRASLPLVLGRNIEGNDVIMDLARAPHLLVAGATGSGKSVCLNCFITSLVTRFTPSQLKLLLVDPKVVEMHLYNTLPHLIVPVINDVQLVVMALRWLITEMSTRYRLLAAVGARNLESFNNRPRTPQPVLDEDGNEVPDSLPYIVLIIDELADIMLTNKQEVENALARLAQMSRAVGIHTIVATQRPSVDVITGVIKANYPSRIAFQTSSQVDSRTIIDGKGAESLLGRGDMLYKPPTAAGMQRIQGAMVSDQELKQLVDFCSKQLRAPQDFEIIKSAAELQTNEQPQDNPDDDTTESLIHAAIEVVVNDRKASISYLQRRLKVGYNKAASLMDILEKRGVVGPQVGTLKREILVDSVENALHNDNY